VEHEGLVLGSSSCLNVAGALQAAVLHGPGKTIVTFACDLGERSASKLYNEDYLKQRGVRTEPEAISELIRRYQSQGNKVWYRQS
jgi:cysteine synthase A